MWIEKDIILLPTNKPTHIVKFNWGGKWRLNFSEEILPIQDEEEYQHLYVLSDEEMKEGDYGYDIKKDVIFKCDDIVPYKDNTSGKTTNEISLLDDTLKKSFNLEDCKKIIVTTDDDLKIGELCGTCDDGFIIDSTKIFGGRKCGCIYSLPIISKPFIERFTQWYNNGNLFNRALVEYEEKVIPMDFNGSIGMTEDYEVVLKTENNEVSIKPSQSLPILKPITYENTPEHKATIEYGKYLVVRKDGKKHLETFNGTGWSYNDNSIIAYYKPKIK